MWKKRHIPVLVIVLLLAIQLIPVDRSNGPETAPLRAAPEVLAVFQQSCFDCHSQQTVWPWYAKVAPVSWWVAHHVTEGREKLDFSSWENLPGDRKRKLAGEIYDEAAQGEMPLRGYPQMHPAARVTGAELNLIKGWSQEVGR